MNYEEEWKQNNQNDYISSFPFNWFNMITAAFYRIRNHVIKYHRKGDRTERENQTPKQLIISDDLNDEY